MAAHVPECEEVGGLESLFPGGHFAITKCCFRHIADVCAYRKQTFES